MYIPGVVVEDQCSVFFGANDTTVNLMFASLILCKFFADFPVILCMLKELFNILVWFGMFD